VIRYRTRDRTCLLPPTSRTMRRMARVCGRTDDMLIIRGVNVFPSQIEEIILRQALFAPVYLLEIDREKNMDRMTVHVELADSCVQHADGERLAIWLGNAIKDVVGITAAVRVLPSRSLERSLGKASRVVDKRSFGESTVPQAKTATEF
jgi:phenylacetate-CoA ligase